MNEIAGAAPHSEPSAPAAYVDRRALSEAWYRALYAPRPKNAAAAHASRGLPATGNAVAWRVPGPPAGRASQRFAREATGAVRRRLAAAPGTSAQRIRAGRISNVARQPAAWRVALARHTMCRLTLPDGGKLDLLVHQRGCRLRIVAIASAPAPATRMLEAALGRARTALALHGIRTDIDVREKGSA